MGRSQKAVTLRPAGNRTKLEDISQAPEMIELKRIYQNMDERGQERTRKHLITEREDGPAAIDDLRGIL